jgi:UDP-N-acetylglucosamine 2-epimerase
MDNYSKNNFKKNKFCLVKKYIVSGYVLKNFKKTIAKKNKFINSNIICFDWSIGTDLYQNLNTNIYNLINFYDDILRLSNVYEDFNFIIKSKEKLKSYKNLEEIIRKIKKKKNIYLYNLSDGMNNFQKLYDNCNIIITKPSSTIDEGIFYGKKVLVHDYGTSFDILIEKYENFNNQALFAHSYDDLKENLNLIITKNINNYHIRKFDKNYYFNNNNNFSFKNFLEQLNS